MPSKMTGDDDCADAAKAQAVLTSSRAEKSASRCGRCNSASSSAKSASAACCAFAMAHARFARPCGVYSPSLPRASRASVAKSLG